MTDFSWAERLVEKGLVGLTRLNGYYHDNFHVEHEGTSYLLRVTKHGADQIDARQLNENDVLRLLEAKGFGAPRLVYISKANNFVLHSYIQGSTLGTIFSDIIGDELVDQSAELLAKLHTADWHATDLPAIGKSRGYEDTRGFAAWLLEDVRLLYERLWAEEPFLFEQADFPTKPEAALLRRIETIDPEHLTLIHADLNKHNAILSADGSQLTMIDWELALWGDGLYDLAAHTWRAGHSAEQTERALLKYIAAMRYRDSFKAIKTQFDFYRDLEVIRSAINDNYRLHKQSLRPANDFHVSHNTAGREWRLKRLEGRMHRARRIWAGA